MASTTFNFVTPTLYYNFSGSGTTEPDATGHGNTASLLRNESAFDLHSGGRLLINNGSNDALKYVPVASAMQASFTATFKYSAGSYGFLWCLGLSGGTSGYNIGYNGDGVQVRVRDTAGGLIIWDSPSVLTPNTDIKFAATYDGDVFKIYINGTQVFSDASLNGPLNLSSSDGSGFRIGYNPLMGGGGGTLEVDDVRWWDTVCLTPAQVLEIAGPLTFSDDFNRANGTLGSNWIDYSGSSALVVSGNKVINSNPSDGSTTTPQWATQALTQTLFSQVSFTMTDKVNSGVDIYLCAKATEQAGIFCRYVAATDTWIIRDYDGGGNTRASIVSPLVANTTYVIRAEYVAGVCTIYRDGVSVLTYNYGTTISGNGNFQKGVGFGLRGNGSGDNWSGGDFVPSLPVTATRTTTWNVAAATTPWVNRIVIAAPRNGTTTHTVDPSSSSNAISGAPFTPTAGRLLLCVAEGAVTSTTPAGWTLPTNGSAVNGTGLYVWWKVATGSDTITTMHNGSNYPVAFAIYEFAAGVKFLSAVTSGASSAYSAGSTNPTLSGLADTPTVMAAAAWGVPASQAVSATWSSPNTEDLDTVVFSSGTDGYWLGVCYQSAYGSASYAPTPTISFAPSGSSERLTWALVATTPVTATRTTTWNVAAGTTSVSASRATIWVTKTAVTASRATTWLVRSVATATRATTWTVLAAISPATRATTWRTSVFVAATRSTTWAAAAGVAASRATTWNVAGSLVQVTANRSTTWRTLAQVTPTRGTTWRALFTVAPATRSTTWAALFAVTPVARPTTWVARARITSTRPTTWNALSTVAPTTRATTWSAQGQVTATRSTTWNVAGTLNFVSTTRSTSWNTVARTSSTRPTTWNTLVPVVGTSTRTTTWAVLTTLAPATRTTTWTTRFQVSGTRASFWNAANVVSTTRQTTWAALVAVGGNRATIWVVRAEIVGVRPTAWVTRALVSAPRSTTWRVIAPVYFVQVMRVTAWVTKARTTGTRSTTWRTLPAAPTSQWLTLYPNTVMYLGTHRIHALYQGSTKIWP